MLSYLTNLSYLSLKKLNQKSINGDDAVYRLAETRTVMERMRPIEQKLQYQIDKLIKMASSAGNGEGKDALSYKPNPNALVTNEGKDESDDEEGREGDDDGIGDEKRNSKKYVPPKLLAVPYNEESEKTTKAIEKARKRAMSSSLIRDLQEQYGHGPEEISETSGSRRKEAESQKDRMRYEEENFVRLQVSKAQKQTAKRVSAKSTLQSLLDFGDYNVDEMPEEKKRKRSLTKGKSQGKGKSKGKGGKGKRR